MKSFDLNHLAPRSFSLDHDIPRVLSLRASVEAVDHEGIEINEQEFISQLNLPGHDPSQDRWVIETPGDPATLIASALVKINDDTRVADANIMVHPDWRRLGVGSLLLSRVVERSRQLDACAVQIYVNSTNVTALSFLHQHGFTPVGTYTELRITSAVRLPPVIWPFGYLMKPYSDVQDLSILTQAMNLGYIPLWGHREVTEDEMASWLPGFNPQGLFLVFSEKGRVVGISRVDLSPERSLKNGQPTGYIDAPGVVPQHRRLDLYRALVLTGIRWLRDQGQTLIEMESWGDKLEVLKMYRELGFTDLRQLVCYEIRLSAGDDTTGLLSPLK